MFLIKLRKVNFEYSPLCFISCINNFNLYKKKKIAYKIKSCTNRKLLEKKDQGTEFRIEQIAINTT